LEERLISLTTSRTFRSAGSNTRIKEWAQHYANRKSVEDIAQENGLIGSTVEEYIINQHHYFDICEKNGIMSKGGMDV
jgi:hypothetical protein